MLKSVPTAFLMTLLARSQTTRTPTHSCHRVYTWKTFTINLKEYALTYQAFGISIIFFKLKIEA